MLKKAKQITAPFWVNEPATKDVLAALNKGSDFSEALFVGGCVRNAVLDIDVSDIDIATTHKPAQVMALLQEANIKAIPTGLDHGTVTAVTDGRTFEVTTLRQDVETDGRHAEVSFTDSWKTDAERRDFTINTLLMNQKGHIYDPTGQGIKDIEKRTVRFVGDPEKRIQEDYLRILRFFRFYATYGHGDPDTEALEACQKYESKLRGLSKERITQEVSKIIVAPAALHVLKIMQDRGILDDLYAPDFDAQKFARLVMLQEEYKATDLVARLIFLKGGTLEKFLDLEGIMILTNQQKKMAHNYFEARGSLRDFEEASLIKSLYHYGSDYTVQAALMKSAHEGVDIPPYLLALVGVWQKPVFPIDGNDVKALGVSVGPDIGILLGRTEEWWISKGFEPCKEECLSYLQSLIKG